MDTKKLSAHLVSLQTTPSYTDATQHTFLELAGNGTLPLSRLALWLSQDRIYAAHAYPRFIGALISRIPFNSSDTISDPSEKLKEEILHVLVKCLDNIMLEVEFFKYTASQFGLDINEWAVRKGTRDYTAEMARVSTASSLEEGIIFLWAMEKVYFDAWSYVKTQQQKNWTLLFTSPSAAAVEKFAANWSTPEFGAFVESLAKLVDRLGVRPGTEEWRKAEDVWARVIELEVEFWPLDGEEFSMRKHG